MTLDLPADWAVSLVVKQVARDLASRELCSGHLALSQDVMVYDASDCEFARFPLRGFLTIEPLIPVD